MNKVVVLDGSQIAWLTGMITGRIERGEAGPNATFELELLEKLRAQGSDDKDKEIQRLRACLSVTTQATTCGCCGEYKHTPWRDDEYGFMCAGCLGRERDRLRKQLGEVPRALERADQLGKDLAAARERINELAADRDKLLDAVDQDATGLSRALAEIKKTIAGFGWVTSSRGPYAWDDQRYQQETYIAFQAVSKILEPALKQSGDIANKAWQTFEKGRIWKLGAEIRRLRDVAKRLGATGTELASSVEGF